MQKKLFFGYALLAMIADSYALEIYKGRIISHKEWTTGNISATFKPLSLASITEMRKIAITKQVEPQQNHTMVRVFSASTSAKGTVNEPVSISGENYVFIMNQTGEKQHYNYILSACVDTNNHMTQCAYYFDDIEIEADGYLYSGESPEVQLIFNQPGIYKSHINSEIYKLENNGVSLQNNSSSMNTIEIS